MNTDIDGIPNATTYRVSYRFRSDLRSNYLYSRVHVIDGYSTFGDIPKIIALSVGAQPEDVVVFNADLVGLTDAEGNRV